MHFPIKEAIELILIFYDES